MDTNFNKTHSDPSVENFLPYITSNIFEDGKPKYLAQELVADVFGEIKKDETCHVKLSSSVCHSIQIKNIPQNDDDDMDPRLKCWKKMLRQRKVLQQRIQLHTGKRAEDVLFNRHATIDEQTKSMLLRLMDTAVRINDMPKDGGTSMGRLKARQDGEFCREIPELLVTKPQLQELVFVGLPDVTRLELAQTLRSGETQWQRSEVLGERLENQEVDIKRVLNYCPSLEQLQVAPGYQASYVPVKNVKRMGEDMLYAVSKESTEATQSDEDKKEEVQPELAVEELTEQKSIEKLMASNIIRINGTPFGFGDSTGILTADLQIYFQCDPMQRVLKTIVNLQNIGNKFIQFKWQQIISSCKDLQKQLALNSEFLFDAQQFVLLPGQQRRIDVMYQPMAVGIKKQRWSLHMQRSPFCGVRRLYIRLHGVCTLPRSFKERLDAEQRFVIDKRIRQDTSRLAKLHAELAPIVEPVHLDCPYERALDEREVFSAQNPGFKSERFADLETLKELYMLVKKPRQPHWDYRIETLRQCIYQHDVEQRNSLQNILTDLIEPMRCNSFEVFDKMHSNPEREVSCFIFVRGIVCSTIDEWEILSDTLEQQFYKSELQRFLKILEEEGQKLPTDATYVDSLITKKVKSCKYFKDALYIQTYTMICDAAENIVSAIESTVHV